MDQLQLAAAEHAQRLAAGPGQFGRRTERDRIQPDHFRSRAGKSRSAAQSSAFKRR